MTTAVGLVDGLGLSGDTLTANTHMTGRPKLCKTQ